MLAYSSIAHAGYILLGILPGTAAGLSAVLTYMLIYAFMNMGAFGVLILLCDEKRRGEELEDYRGLAKINPAAAALMLVFMFSLTGIPPTAGFIGKFNLLLAALQAGYVKTVVVAVILSAISAYYYLRVVRYMYMLAPEKENSADPARSFGLTAALTLAMLMVIAIGVAPGWLLDLTSRSLLGFSY
jgi:NADH-quinone oxidoreductase subunit N